jgi:TPR repeat protein
MAGHDFTFGDLSIDRVVGEMGILQQPAKVMPITATRGACGVICSARPCMEVLDEAALDDRGHHSIVLICAGVLVRTDHKNRQQAAAYRIHAEQGDAESQFKLGSLYSRGKGVSQDYGEAVRWYRKSAEQGYAKAEFNLGSMFRAGKGVPQDYAEAEHWLRKAAEQGNERAEEGLGFLYYRGEGVPQDYGEAARWYRIAAEQGDANAQYVLGYLYYYGFGVQRDRVHAHDLLQQAAARGNEDAKRALERSRNGISIDPGAGLSGLQ